MSTTKRFVIPASEFDSYKKDHVILSRFKEYVMKPICQISNMPVDRCENVLCASNFTHKTRMEYIPVDHILISKTEQSTVP